MSIDGQPDTRFRSEPEGRPRSEFPCAATVAALLIAWWFWLFRILWAPLGYLAEVPAVRELIYNLSTSACRRGDSTSATNSSRTVAPLALPSLSVSVRKEDLRLLDVARPPVWACHADDVKDALVARRHVWEQLRRSGTVQRLNGWRRGKHDVIDRAIAVVVDEDVDVGKVRVGVFDVHQFRIDSPHKPGLVHASGVSFVGYDEDCRQDGKQRSGCSDQLGPGVGEIHSRDHTFTIGACGRPRDAIAELWPNRLPKESHRSDSGAGEPAGVAGSRVAGGHHGVTRSALDAARRWAESGAQGRRRKQSWSANLPVPAPDAIGLSHPRAMVGRGTRAGRSSQQKYNELMKSWHRRNRMLFVILGLLCASIVVASFVASRVWESQAWTLGLLGGGAGAFFMTARLSGPGWIENWQQGAWGEQSTAKVLRPLEKAGWVVLHDLPAGRGNVDHIAVGPGGVFLLDSKRLGGSAVVDERGVTVHRFGDSDLSYSHPGPGHLLSLARQTHARVLARTRIKEWVTPVMVMWGEFPQGTVEGRCVYIHGDELAAWLGSRPPRVAPARVPQLAEAVRSAWAAEIRDGSA